MASPAKPPLNEPTYLRVKRAIIGDLIGHGFQPGDHLTIEMLTSRYNVSHMPIREALRQLEGEGILVSIAHRGFRIEALNERYICNMYDIRIGIETMLARRAAQHVGRADMDRLRAIHDRYIAAVNAGDNATVIGMNVQFHDVIHDLAHNPEAVQLLEVRTRIVRSVAQTVDAHVDQDRAPTVAEHARIIEALAAHDADGASQAIFDHLDKARDRLLVRVEKAGHLLGARVAKSGASVG
jgi:DNA-binding GntR family transcriptional regulator